MRHLVFLPLLSLASCQTTDVTYSTDFDRCHMFGDKLDAGEGARLICWPADDDGRSFRCVQDRIDCVISEASVLTWPEPVPANGTRAAVRLPDVVGSVIVILPPRPSEELRSRAMSLAADVTCAAPWAGRHFVIADRSWNGVAGGKELARRLRDLHTRAKAWRATESDDGMFFTWDDLSNACPDAIIVPVEGEDRYLVLRCIRRGPPDPADPHTPRSGSDGFELIPAAWEAKSREFLSKGEILRLPRPASHDGEPYPLLFEIVFGEGEAARTRALELAAELSALPVASVYLQSEKDPVIAKGELPPGFQPVSVCNGLASRVDVLQPE